MSAHKPSFFGLPVLVNLGVPPDTVLVRTEGDIKRLINLANAEAEMAALRVRIAELEKERDAALARIAELEKERDECEFMFAMAVLAVGGEIKVDTEAAILCPGSVELQRCEDRERRIVFRARRRPQRALDATKEMP